MRPVRRRSDKTRCRARIPSPAQHSALQPSPGHYSGTGTHAIDHSTTAGFRGRSQSRPSKALEAVTRQLTTGGSSCLSHCQRRFHWGLITTRALRLACYGRPR